MATVLAAAEAVTSHVPDVHEPIRAPFAQLALLVWAVLPLFVPINSNWNVIVTATLAVYIGCCRSVKSSDAPPTEGAMTTADALKFPLIGSAVLLALFVVFKLFDRDLINLLLTAYFVVLGCAALFGTILPVVELPFSAKTRAHSYARDLKIPFMKEPTHVAITVPEVVSFVLSAAFCGWYCLKKHWLANNTLGLAFSIQGVEYISVGKLATGALLLSGLFFYDIFWVFGTPVMVSVAKSLDAPIKLLFPRPDAAAGESPFSMLGLGDVVIPGIFVAMCLRYDVEHGSSYFRSAFGGYTAGLATTIVIMNWFQAAQPALLYIVPAVLGTVGLHSMLRGEVVQLWNWSEEDEEQKPDGSKAVTEEAELKQIEDEAKALAAQELRESRKKR